MYIINNYIDDKKCCTLFIINNYIDNIKCCTLYIVNNYIDDIKCCTLYIVNNYIDDIKCCTSYIVNNYIDYIKCCTLYIVNNYIDGIKCCTLYIINNYIDDIKCLCDYLCRVRKWWQKNNLTSRTHSLTMLMIHQISFLYYLRKESENHIIFAWWVIFHTFVAVCWLFSSLAFFKTFFQEHYQSANGLDPDQDRHSVGPDLGPNCL